MRDVAYRALSVEGFAKYGQYANMINPRAPRIGEEPIEFYRDMAQSYLGAVPVGSFGVCRVVKRPFIIDISEYHDFTCETVMPLDGDVLMHVAPAGPDNEFPFEQAEVFKVPKGTLAVLRPGVWHHAPYAFGCEFVNCLIMLPERTYLNDCKVYAFPEAKPLKITGDGTR